MRILLLLFVALTLFGCEENQSKENQFFSSKEDLFRYHGRTSPVDSGVNLITSAASTEVRVFGDTVVAFFENDQNQHHSVTVEMNGKRFGRYRVNNDSLVLSLSENNDAGTVLKIFKDTEAANGNLIFTGLKAEKIAGLPEEDRPLIEFIGNSITCGMGADTAQIPCGEGEWYDQHNAYLAYGPIVARTLNADYRLNCVSGMGIYRNWNDENQPTMPDVYPNQNLNSDPSQKADFSGKAPDVVSIALGTNDLSHGDGEKQRSEFDQKNFVGNYISFVESIYNYYPETKVVLLSSPMVGEKESKILVESLHQVADNFEQEIAVFEFEKMNGQGCTTHPDLADHRVMAEKLLPFIKKQIQ